jgi:hypothetical protein
MTSLTGSKNSEETSSEGEPEVSIQMGMDPYSFIGIGKRLVQH